MGNTLLNISMITNEALRILKNNLTAAKHVNRSLDGSFGVDGAKIGYTCNVRKPIRYVGAEGPALVVEDMTETMVPVTLNRQAQVGMSFTTADLKLQIDDFSQRVIQPAVANIANRVDAAVLQLSEVVWNAVSVGASPGTPVTDIQPFLQAQVKLNNNLTPMDGRRTVHLTPDAEATTVYGLRTLFQSATQIKEQYEQGMMGRAAGFDFYMDQNCYSHTVGALGTTGAIASNPVVSVSSAQTGNSITTNGWDASINNILLPGDTFQLAGVYLVNQQSRQSTNKLQDFVVQAPVSSDGAGNATITFNPPITPSGAYQTVSASPAVGAALTVWGVAHGSFSSIANVVSPQLMGWHPDAITLVTAPLPVPNGVDMAGRAQDPQLGLSLRIVRDYSIDLDQLPTRVDLLFGVAALRPELAVKIPT